jgi:hypothetical protein
MFTGMNMNSQNRRVTEMKPENLTLVFVRNLATLANFLKKRILKA